MPKIIEAFEAGTGIYTVRETAFYARLHPNTIRAWFFREDAPPRFRRPTLTFEGAPLLSFTDFVEALYVSELRSRFHISFHRIRKAIDTAPPPPPRGGRPHPRPQGHRPTEPPK